MAYDQHSSYEAPRRGYHDQVAPQQPRQQYQQERSYGVQPQQYQKGSSYSGQQQQYAQHSTQSQPNYGVAEEYGTFDPYAQDAGNPYGDSTGHTAHAVSYNNAPHASQGYAQSYGHPGQPPHAYAPQQDNRAYGQAITGPPRQETQSYGSSGQSRPQQDYQRQAPDRSYGQVQQGSQNISQGYAQQSNGYVKTAGQGYTQHADQRYAQNGSNGYVQGDDQGYAQDGGQAYAQSSNGRNGHAHNPTAPVQNGNQAYAQGSNGRMQGGSQSYGQSSADHVANDRQGYAQGDGQVHASQRPQTANTQNSYASSNGQYQEERRYDPRYQQRPTTSQSQSQGQAMKSPTGSTFSAQQGGYAPEARQAATTRSNANLQSSHSAPSFPAAKPTGPKKLTMEEWKAQEKAKMHLEASKPETLAQDNAFPTFPSKRPDSSRGGGQSALSMRSSEEQTRPSTASSLRPDGRRPSFGRKNSSQHDPSDSARPSIDHKPHAFESARPSMDSQHHPEHVLSPLHRTQTPPQQAPRPARTDSYNTANTASPGRTAARPVVQTINTAQSMPPPLNPQPMSPNQGRPSTSDSNRYARRPSEQPLSPLGKFALSAQPQAATRQPEQPRYPQHQAQQSVLSDVYDGYYDKRDTVASKPSVTYTPPTRDEQIEAEMPDFDSAAPSQTSQLHKRKQTIDQHLSQPAVDAPPVPMMPASVAGHGSTSSGNFDFGFSGGQSNGYGQRQYQPEQSLERPVQPFANETHERRSMDDTRQGQQTLVNGRPPPQRFYGNNAPPRPDYDRQATTNSDPGLQRVGSAPPGRAGPQQSAQPGVGYDARSTPTPINPDALPAHPTPVRPGLIAGNASAAARPPPVRNYGTAAPVAAAGGTAAQTPAPRALSAEAPKTPVTQAELQQLRAQCDANPQSMKTALLYAKKLVEASKVLANEGGRADPKTTAKNRERYLMEAYKRVKKLSSAGYPDAQFYLADCYGQGMLGLEVDPKEAFKLYQAAAKAGHGTAAYRTAVCCEIGADEGGGTSRDYPRAVQWYRRAAALGETAAMFKVGMIALKGLLGQPRSLGEATIWLKRAAERADKDNPHALHELAVLYETANSTPEIRQKIIPDDAYALSLYRQAADFGAKHSQFRLGQAYEYGQLGLGIDHRSSIAWYSKAAAQGEHQAELALSGWYLTGAPGILEHSDTEAYLWARKAAQAEPPLAKAMFAMGYFLETGIGCPVNIEEAKRWYGRAASYKHPKALERLEAIKRGVKGGYKAMPANARGKLNRKDQKQDEAECVMM